MTEPEDERAAAAGGRGRLRASRMDRERVIELLKVAFVQDRLTHDELDTRVGLALASRTYADLADLTADIPADIPPLPGRLRAGPAGTPARTLTIAARRSGICMLVPLALMGVMALTNAKYLCPWSFSLGSRRSSRRRAFWVMGWSTPGSSGAPAGSCRRPRAGMAGDSRAGGPAAPAVIRLGPEPAPTGPASTCAHAGGTGGAHPGGVSGRHVVHGPPWAPYNRPRPQCPATGIAQPAGRDLAQLPEGPRPLRRSHHPVTPGSTSPSHPSGGRDILREASPT